MHSEAYRAAMAELQRFRAVPLSEQARVRVRVRVLNQSLALTLT